MWQCTKCRESVEDSFEVCWNCGTSRDGVEDPSFQKAEDTEVDSNAVVMEFNPTTASPVVSTEHTIQGGYGGPSANVSNTCHHCGSKKLIQGLPLRVSVTTAEGSGWGDADVVLHGAPEAWILKDPVLGGLNVRICGECGHAELHASNFRRLYEVYENTR